MHKTRRIKFILFIGILTVVILSFGCKKKKYSTHFDKTWKTYSVDSGKRVSTPLNIPLPYTFQSRWDTGCAKGLTGLVNKVMNVDSMDWSKMSGFKYTVTQHNNKPDKYSAVTWRSRTETLDSLCYDPKDSTNIDTVYYKKDYMEFGPYFNDYPNNPIVLPVANEILRVELGQVVHWVKSYHNKRAKIEIWTNTGYVSKDWYMGNYFTFYNSGFYYGGTSAAPNDITVEIKQ